MDRLRQALGDEQLTYLGYSYGTTLGSTYAELFPDKVRALVLDAAVDPDGDPQADAEQSAASLEAGFDAFVANCVGLIAGCPHGAEPRGRSSRACSPRRHRRPIPSSEPDQDGETRAGHAGRRAHRHPGRPVRHRVLAAAGPGPRRRAERRLRRACSPWPTATPAGSRTARYSNLFDANIAINCADTDTGSRRTRTRCATLAAEWNDEVPALRRRVGHRALHLLGLGGRAHAAAGARRRGQRADPRRRQLRRPGDAARRARSTWPRSSTSGVLLAWQGQGHTAYPKTECVNAAVNAYLIDLTPPAGRPHLPCVTLGAPERYGAALMASSKDAVVLDVDGHEVRVSSPEKPYFAERGIRKIDVVEYFVVGRRGHPVRPEGPADDAGALAGRGVRGRPDLDPGGQHRRRVLPEAGAQERPAVGADGAHHLPQRADGGRDRARLGGGRRLVRQPRAR